MNVGVFLPNWIGDVVMATPALRALRRHYGTSAKLVGIMKPYVSPVLDGTDWLDERILLHRRSPDPALRPWQVLKELRARQFDTLILMPNSLSSALIGWLSGARRRIGDDRGGRGWLLTDRVSAPRVDGKFQPRSAVDHYLALAYAAGCAPEPTTLELTTRPQDEAAADVAWERLGLLQGRPVIAFNTGSAASSARHWPAEHFVELAHRIVKYTDAIVLAMCGPSERDAAQTIAQRLAHPRVKSMADEDTSLGAAKACLRRSQLLVTTDSGPRHIAAAFRTPTITLSGPIDPRWSHSYNPREIVLRKEVPCGPCGHSVCPLQHTRCMKELTVDTVFAAVQNQLRQSRLSDAA